MDERALAALEGRYEVRIGDWLSRGWDLFIANWGPYVLYGVLVLLITAAGQGVLDIIIGLHLAGGFFVVALKQSRGERTEFGDFWSAFQLFVPFLLAGLLRWILVGVGLVFCILPGIYLAVSYLLVAPILWDRRIDFWEAMELSRKVVTRHWFSWFAFALLLVLINVAGFLLCLVGLLFSIPLSYCALAAAYEDVLGPRAIAPAPASSVQQQPSV